MPELPEVETVVRALKERVLNKSVEAIDVYYGKQIFGDIYSIIGKNILDIKRRGKNIIFCFDGLYMIVHLRMEGKFFIKDRNEEISKHEHIVFHFDQFDLRYHDTRKFGEIRISDSSFVDVGVEATSITEDILSLNKPIKEILLDQKIIAGIGNIYADEVCFYARVMPDEVIKKEKYPLIIKGAHDILLEAIKCGGTTIRSYNSLGIMGHYQDHLMVHTKKKCSICGYEICTKKVAGRTSYYCPNCQKDNVIIGITGGISTGKSMVDSFLNDVIDCDKIVASLWEKEEVLNRIAKCFGLETVSKDIVSDIIFNDEEKRKMLNGIIHPLVKKEILSKIHKGINYVDVPLLFESGFDKLCDYTICVYLDDENAALRLMKRNNITYEEAMKRIKAQMPIKEKKRKAMFVIDNSRDRDYTREQLFFVLKEIGICQ